MRVERRKLSRKMRLRFWLQKQQVRIWLQWLLIRHKMGVHYLARSKRGVVRRCLICGKHLGKQVAKRQVER